MLWTKEKSDFHRRAFIKQAIEKGKVYTYDHPDRGLINSPSNYSESETSVIPFWSIEAMASKGPIAEEIKKDGYSLIAMDVDIFFYKCIPFLEDREALVGANWSYEDWIGGEYAPFEIQENLMHEVNEIRLREFKQEFLTIGKVWTILVDGEKLLLNSKMLYSDQKALLPIWSQESLAISLLQDCSQPNYKLCQWDKDTLIKELTGQDVEIILNMRKEGINAEVKLDDFLVVLNTL